MTDKTPKTSTITLDGDERELFERIRDFMMERLPGIAPTNADVMRHALYLAVEHIAAEHEPPPARLSAACDSEELERVGAIQSEDKQSSYIRQGIAYPYFRLHPERVA